MNLQQLQRVEDVPQEKLSDMNVDNLPNQWKVVKLNNQELFEFENGLWTGKKEPFIDCPVIRNTNFTNDGSLNLTNVAIIPIEQRQLEKKRLIPGDIIIERSGGGPQQPVGRVVFFDLSEGNYCFSNFTTRLRVIDKAAVDPRYLHLYLLYFHYSGQTERLQNRTTGIRNLAFEDYKSSSIPLPPLREQCIIAKVLQIVQEAIQTRRDELELERERKTALMDYLFTHGTCGESTKQTEIGIIPENWEVVRLGELCANNLGIIQTGPFGSQLHASDYRDQGTPVINPTHLGINTIVEDSIPLISKEDAERLSKHYLMQGDVLISRRGDFSRYSYITSRQAGWMCGTGCLLIRIKNPRVNNQFFAISIGLEYIQNYLENNATGTIMPNLNTKILENLPLALCPSLDEQHQIVSIWSACADKINALEKEISTLQELFRALLEELTTGRLSALPLIAEDGTNE